MKIIKLEISFFLNVLSTLLFGEKYLIIKSLMEKYNKNSLNFFILKSIICHKYQI